MSNNLRMYINPQQDCAFKIVRNAQCCGGTGPRTIAVEDLNHMKRYMDSASEIRGWLMEFLFFSFLYDALPGAMRDSLAAYSANRFAEKPMLFNMLRSYFGPKLFVEEGVFAKCTTFGEVTNILDTRPGDVFFQMDYVDYKPPTIAEFKECFTKWNYAAYPVMSNEDFKVFKAMQAAQEAVKRSPEGSQAPLR